MRTRDGRVYTTPTVICTCGAWSKQIGAMVDVDLPIEPLRRQIAFTTPLYPRPPRVPFTIDYSTTAYFHCNDDGSGLLIGIAAKEQAVGFDTAVTTDWHDQLRAALAQFAPSLTGVQFASGWAGLYEITPDCNALIGEADTSGFRFLYAAGFPGTGSCKDPRWERRSATCTWAPSPPSTYPDSMSNGSSGNTDAPNSTSSDAEHSGYALPRGRLTMTTAQAGIPTTPTTEELVDRARAALQRCGVDPHTLKADA